MKIGAQLQLAMQNMDRQADLARRVGGELDIDSKEVKQEVKEAKEAAERLGKNVDVEA